MSKNPLPAFAGALFRFDFWQETLELLRKQLAELADDAPRRKLLEASIEAAEQQKRIIYLLEVPTYQQRIEFEAELGEIAHAPQELELAELMRDEARRIYGDPSPEYELASDVADAGRASDDDRKRSNALLAKLRTRSLEINRAMVARERAAKMADYLAVKFFLHGAEGIDFAIERDAMGVTDECLTYLQGDIELIGRRVRTLMRLSGVARKNLLSPSPSASSQASSTAAERPTMAAPAGSC